MAMQHKNLEAVLEKLSGGAGASAAGSAGMEAASGAGAGLGAMSGKLNVAGLKKLLGGKGVKAGASGVIGYMLLEGLLRTLLQGGQQLSQTNLAGREMEAQGESLSPEAVGEQALQPVTRSQRDFALSMLMQQLGGGRGGRAQLARGEVLS